ncbi:polysaccharide biosynthesis tyrosine autokinase [Novosphingobium sp. SL115]|uniref:GumC family protein n=1 Tax=Novosphingobium sp. SL115 TaxID=2995150 RepID=UPI002272DF4B|nr:polysaccharide biosynthesis tyrosine autokinase [Novosphingobium sp. SL115]MCY1669489.1 polysaccharide biosynthesis tyrosine autokinase [Novosphingobium sp. SL115]
MSNTPISAMQAPDAVDPVDDGMNWSLRPLLTQVWQSIVRWRWLIAGIVAAVLTIALIGTLLKAPVYTAKAQIEISREQKNITSVEGLESAGQGRDLEFYETQYALLKAQSLAERIAKKLDLKNSEAFFAAYGQKLYEPPEGAKSESKAVNEERQRRAVQLLLDNVEISPIRLSRLVDIKLQSRSPALSAKITNVWVQEFIGLSMDRQFASTADARKFLEERLGVLKARLEQSEREVVTFASSRDIVTLDTVRDADGRTFTQRTLASADLEALNQALSVAKADRVTAQSRAGGSADNSTEALNNPALTQLRAKRAEVAAQYAKLLVRFEPAYPEAVTLKQEMAALDAAIGRETSRIGGSRQQAFQEAMARERDLTTKVNGLKAELDRQRQDSIQFNIYQREADTNRQLYDALLQRYKEIGVAGTVGVSNISIVDFADVPQKPSSPNLPLNMVIAFLIGLAIACASVFALEQIDEGIRTPDDVRNHLGLPLLGNSPKVDDHNPIDDLGDAKSALYEAMFSLRSVLAFSTSHGFPKSLVVTSTQASEGKSTTALALAFVVARTGKSVVLVDADLRSPSQHANLAIDNRAGLANALAGEGQAVNYVQHIPVGNFSALTTGPAVPNPAELFSTERLREIVLSLGEVFDHVIVDAPPVLGLADAPLIGTSAEGMVFVIEAERTSRRAARTAIQRLQAVGNRVLGVVVTKIDLKRHNYGYGYGYGYGYSYGYGEKAEV